MINSSVAPVSKPEVLGRNGRGAKSNCVTLPFTACASPISTVFFSIVLSKPCHLLLKKQSHIRPPYAVKSSIKMGHSTYGSNSCCCNHSWLPPLQWTPRLSPECESEQNDAT